ncbi:MAG: hypothetical protein GDA40_08110 [Rhodobacteraceae bacterium]|nr:hypothetical protein [Paracoccaceae bacterium]
MSEANGHKSASERRKFLETSTADGQELMSPEQIQQAQAQAQSHLANKDGNGNGNDKDDSP